MSVGALFEFYHRPYASGGDIGFPAGIWVADGQVTGDGLGGTRSIVHAFQVLPGISNSNIYSLEQVDANDVGLKTEWTLVVGGMDQHAPGASLITPRNTFYRFTLNDVSNTGPVLSCTSPNVQSVFLGQPSRNASFSALLTATIEDAVAEDTFSVKLQGYFWTPGAMNTTGGLKRPPFSIYGV